VSEDPVDKRIEKVTLALDEFKAMTLQVMQAILSGTSAESPAMAAKSLELEKLTRIANRPLVGLTQSDHSEAARETVRTYVERMVGFAAKKSLENKELTDDRRAEVVATLGVWEAAIGALKPLALPAAAVNSGSADGELAAIRRAHQERKAATG
jgi:AcrR family transcriptional regulator